MTKHEFMKWYETNTLTGIEFSEELERKERQLAEVIGTDEAEFFRMTVELFTREVAA